MAVDSTLKAQFDLLDDDGLVAHRRRLDLTPEAYAALDRVLAERNLSPDHVDEIRVAADDSMPNAETVRYAERTYGTMRTWLFVILLWWPLILLISYTLKLRNPLEVVLLSLMAVWLIAILAYLVYLARTARALGKSAVAWVCVAVLFFLIGWIVAWAVMSDALRNLKALSKGPPAA